MAPVRCHTREILGHYVRRVGDYYDDDDIEYAVMRTEQRGSGDAKAPSRPPASKIYITDVVTPPLIGFRARAGGG